MIGGFLTYRLARKGGKETLSRRFPRRKLDKVYKAFERWGLGAIAVPAMLPPPVPMVPFVLAAGAMQYPVRKFLFALTLGRISRYTLLAFLAARYGRQLLAFIAKNGRPFLWIVVGLIAVATVILIVLLADKRQRFLRRSGS